MPYASEHFKATVWFRNAWTVRSVGGDAFAQAGDSGALVVDEDAENAVGVLFAANPSNTHGWIVPITDVLAHPKLKGFSLVSGH